MTESARGRRGGQTSTHERRRISGGMERIGARSDLVCRISVSVEAISSSFWVIKSARREISSLSCWERASSAETRLQMSETEMLGALRPERSNSRMLPGDTSLGGPDASEAISGLQELTN